ncbi:MAG TPA: OsmC family protein [Ignavibacteriaceae bacterium]|nr:OsmC family protein [Ignavibacteriaceae bacterium]
MPIRKASAEWQGDLRSGKGSISTETGVIKNTPYNFTSRFESGSQTNPEEILGAAHAACYSMALANGLATAGFKVNSVVTEDKVHIEKLESGFTITKIEVHTEASVDGIDDTAFQKFAEDTKKGCPVSKALASVDMILSAKLK